MRSRLPKNQKSPRAALDQGKRLDGFDHRERTVEGGKCSEVEEKTRLQRGDREENKNSRVREIGETKEFPVRNKSALNSFEDD